MKYVFLFLVFLFLSCDEKVNEVNTSQQDTTVVSIKSPDTPKKVCDFKKDLTAKSALICKVETLKDLKHNYLLKKIDTGYTLAKTRIYRGVSFSKNSDYYSTPEIDSLFQALESLNANTQSVNTCLVKSTINIGGNTYPRAYIEEIVFYTEGCASNYMKLIDRIKGEGSLMFRIDKSPHSIFRDKNRVYYISAGGFYMLDYYEDIEVAMKQKTCL